MSGGGKRSGGIGRGFRRAASLVAQPVRAASESRGFSVSRVLTHWSEIAGPDIAGHTRPVEIAYGKGGGLGATLTVLTTGAHAPIVELQKERLRERVNACYGYAAIGRIRITQTAPQGFAEGRADFDHTPEVRRGAVPGPEALARAERAASGVGDDDLRVALSRLGAHILNDTQD